MAWVRKYYKYVLEPWTQPILTSDTTTVAEGVITTTANSSSSGMNPYKALDGKKSGAEGNGWRTENKPTGWWQVVFPYQILITGLKHYNCLNYSSVKNVIGRFYTDDTLTVPIGDAINTPNSDWSETVITGITNGILTDTIYFDKTGGGNYTGIGELEITAQKLIDIIEGTPEDYDFYEDTWVMYAPKETIRKYYKYAYEPWTQPILSGSITYTSFGDVIVSASSFLGTRDPYKAMDGVKSGASSGSWQTNAQAVGWWKVVFPYKIKITGLTHYNPYTDSSRNTVGRFYTDETLTTPIGDSINTVNTSWAKTVITGIPESGIITDTIYFAKTNQPYAGIGELEITATKQTVIEGTSSDYDFYRDEPVYSLPKEDDLRLYCWVWGASQQPIYTSSNKPKIGDTLYDRDGSIRGNSYISQDSDGNTLSVIIGSGSPYIYDRFSQYDRTILRNTYKAIRS